MYSFEGKTVLVTGASQGIGAAAAKLFAEGGANVVIVDINETQLIALQEELVQNGSSVLALKCDVSVEEEVYSVVEKANAQFGNIDILINNAGIFRVDRGPFAESKTEYWKKKIDINIYGTLYFCRAVINQMIEKKWGRIINIASVAGTYGIANMADYSLTKGAILAFSKALAREVAPFGVLVNTVSPGNINPDVAFLPQSSYMNRSGLPKECAEMICFLASDNASFCCGCDYVVDGCRKKI